MKPPQIVLGGLLIPTAGVVILTVVVQRVTHGHQSTISMQKEKAKKPGTSMTTTKKKHMLMRDRRGEAEEEEGINQPSIYNRCHD